MAQHRVWVNPFQFVIVEDSVMTWMKPGEFECENGRKAVVWGRVPDPCDTPSFPWTGYVEEARQPNRLKPVSMKMSWSDDGKPNVNGFDPGWSIKPPRAKQYAAVDKSGNVNAWMDSLGRALNTLSTHVATQDALVAFVIEVESSGGKLLPNTVTLWFHIGCGAYRRAGSDTCYSMDAHKVEITP
jgi:hypothetical protein